VVEKLENRQKRKAQIIRQKLLDMEKLDMSSLDSLISIKESKSQREKSIIYDENYAEFTRDSEYLYALLWRDGWRKKHLDDCEKLIIRFGGLLQVFQSNLWQLETICNEMGLSFSGSFVRRRLDSAMMIEQKLWFSRAQRGTVMTNYQTLASYVVKTFAMSKQEEVRLVYLDRDKKVVGKETISIGEDNYVSIEIKRLLAYALRADAHSFIIAHNHLGSDANPSDRDVDFTRRIEGAAHLVGVPLFDHLIVCGTDWFSFRIAGMLEIAPSDGRESELLRAEG
jgi:DNA repair protein RadC